MKRALAVLGMAVLLVAALLVAQQTPSTPIETPTALAAAVTFTSPIAITVENVKTAVNGLTGARVILFDLDVKVTGGSIKTVRIGAYTVGLTSTGSVANKIAYSSQTPRDLPNAAGQDEYTETMLFDLTSFCQQAGDTLLSIEIEAYGVSDNGSQVYRNVLVGSVEHSAC